jgi:hypothetical protein
MNWQDLFSHCWNNSMEAQIQVRDYVIHPDKLTTPNRVAFYDRSAEETIKRMEEYVEALKGYRKALAERYAVLMTMPYNMRLDLIRNKGWSDKKVTYTLRLVRTYEDGHEEYDKEVIFPGVQRREALKAFETLKRERPGIECLVDIEKKSWEK